MSAGADTLLREQVGAVETFLEEVTKTDGLDEQRLGERFEVFVGDQVRELRVIDKDANLPVFGIRNKFVRDGEKVRVVSEVSYDTIDRDRFPKTISALDKLNWTYSK